MIANIPFDIDNFQSSCDLIFQHWGDSAKKVFALRASKPPNDVKQFYFNNFKYIGEPVPIGEDATQPRNKQRHGSIWFEVRNDSKIKNAYRHSTHGQPLHTDGSYITNFPSSTIMACVKNDVIGGETIFLDSKLLYKILKKNNPILLKALETELILHERSGDSKIKKIIQKTESDFKLNYNYYCISKKIKSHQRAMIEEFQNFLLNNDEIRSNIEHINLNPGDSVFWRDSFVLHGRNSFQAKNDSDRFLWKVAIDIGNNV